MTWIEIMKQISRFYFFWYPPVGCSAGPVGYPPSGAAYFATGTGAEGVWAAPPVGTPYSGEAGVVTEGTVGGFFPSLYRMK